MKNKGASGLRGCTRPFEGVWQRCGAWPETCRQLGMIAERVEGGLQNSGRLGRMQLPKEPCSAGNVAAERLVTALDLDVTAPALDLEQLVQNTGGERRVGVEPAVQQA
jgi:hypothetical protein